MALYAYHCPECTTDFEARRPMAQADDLAPCPACGSLLTERIFTAPALAGRASAPALSAASETGTTTARRHRYGCPCC